MWISLGLVGSIIRATGGPKSTIGSSASLNLAPMTPLSLLETRVLGTLVEKQHTVPDSYPLSLNALVLRLQPEDQPRPP